MNRITPEALYRLLPAVHRLRDAREGGPLKALVAVLAREGAVIEENIEQLLDNLFIETCDEWAAPYVGGTIGYRALHQIDGASAGNRAEVANTIAYRRRKGTAAVLEALARDVTGWPAHVVEFFQVTATCQHMNHIRPGHRLAPDLRDPLPLESLGRAFDTASHTADVRSIRQSPGRKGSGGRHNFPNIGLFLWRLVPMDHLRVPAFRVDDRRYLFDPLGAPRQLVNRPAPEDTITSVSRPEHVPVDLSRRLLAADPALWYGRAFEIFVDDERVPATRIEACDLSDDGPAWNHSPHDAISAADLAAVEGGDPLSPPANALIRVDPVLGRIAFPNAETGVVRTSFRTGFPARIGGGHYDRAATLTRDPGQNVVSCPSTEHPNIQSALDAVRADGGIVEIADSEVFTEAITITADAGTELILRAANGMRPILRPGAPIALTGAAESRIVIDGVVVEGFPVTIAPAGGESPKSVTLRHLTLIPGRGFTAEGQPATPGATSLEVTATGLELLVDRCVTGPIRLHQTTNAEIRDSIVDAASVPAADSAEGLAIAGPAGEGDPAGTLSIVAATVIGRIFARSFELVSNAILHARTTDGSAPVRALRRQHGCMRFSFVPDGSITPRRYRCQPQLAVDQAVAAAEARAGGPIADTERALIRSRIVRRMRPGFVALSASHPAYAQLRPATPPEIRTGASDESEMGAYHLLFAPQREANLRIRLEEYLRFGLEAGIFRET